MTNPTVSGELIEERHDHRTAIVRSAILFTPLAIGSAVLLVIAGHSLITRGLGALIPTIFLSILSLATIFEAQANLRDLRSEPTITRGPVVRAWTKARFLVIGHVHYLLVERRVFEVNAISAAEVEEGRHVEIAHWPHTNTLITLHRSRERPDGDDRGGGR